jgi:hypothetical protein
MRAGAAAWNLVQAPVQGDNSLLACGLHNFTLYLHRPAPLGYIMPYGFLTNHNPVALKYVVSPGYVSLIIL